LLLAAAGLQSYRLAGLLQRPFYQPGCGIRGSFRQLAKALNVALWPGRKLRQSRKQLGSDQQQEIFGGLDQDEAPEINALKTATGF
jgi:hypothetical protein